MKKFLLPTILCLFISIQTVFGATYCESTSINFETVIGYSLSLPPDGPEAGKPTTISLISGCKVAYNSTTVSVNSSSYIAFKPINYFSFNVGENSLDISYNSTPYTWNSSISEWLKSGNTASYSKEITIEKQPVATIGVSQYCSNLGLVPLTCGSPSGGTYSGDGISGNILNTGNVSVANHSITYTYYDGICKSSSASSTFNIIAPAQGSITYPTNNAKFCINASSITLTATPGGGSFTGSGTNGAIFTPSTAGAGSKTITYNFTDGNSCSNSATSTINVISLPTISFPNLTGVCIDKAAFQLTAASGSPATGSGVYSGTGTSGTNGTTFTPSDAGAGVKTLTYTYTDGDGCTNSASNTIAVFALPTPTLTKVQPDSICVNASPVALGGGSPVSAVSTYIGNGVTNSVFNPATTGTGLQTITYNYTDGNGCSNSVSNTIKVLGITTLSMDTSHICLNATPILLSAAMKASPPGGTYSGLGVTPATGSFNPPAAGEGLKPITYTFQNASQCTNTITKNMRVISLPSVKFATISPICRDSKPVVLSGGTPTGGLYSAVKGVSNGVFDPATPGITPGPQVITYAVTDAKTGCINSINQTLTILDAPKPAWPKFLSEPQLVMCNGSDQTLTLENGDTYSIQWLSGNTSVGTDKSYAIKGITQDVPLTIKYKDSNTNCVSDDRNIIIELDKIKAEFSAPTTVKVGNAVTFTDLSINASKWSWTMGLEGPSVSQSPVFYFNIVGVKTIKLITTSSNNCKDSITKTNYITVSTTGVNGIKNAGSEQVLVYPNPFNDVINIDLTDKNEDVTIDILTISGTKVINRLVKKANGVVTIDVSGLATGAYLMVLTDGAGATAIKLVKE
jgi:hypothetical protein